MRKAVSPKRHSREGGPRHIAGSPLTTAVNFCTANIALTSQNPLTAGRTVLISFGFLRGTLLASSAGMHGGQKRTVYIIRSDRDSSRHYVGVTNNVDERLEWHNRGPAGHTVSDRPWSLVVSMEFPTEREAVRFEKYLKSGSGRAFSKRHFGPPHQHGEIS